MHFNKNFTSYKDSNDYDKTIANTTKSTNNKIVYPQNFIVNGVDRIGVLENPLFLQIDTIL